ncbi:tannase/feruloyl esterase family alpha/beta hydrolase [Acetobacter thailandicus]|uniref:tannase/feruloyl esterase family alpha/beta hydrolase n=1 Tax=Acetobacter thailandicus TaxID=1502842 RepID=UPI001BAD857A|nr:tannase/feruloyl esterase family alpha/beta hydrolase [Acetobacter thailandicus]MBS0961285.1 tannase/feruloyl esterase family alpha/beta hydrolase [Acetobacter thailandicus]
MKNRHSGFLPAVSLLAVSFFLSDYALASQKDTSSEAQSGPAHLDVIDPAVSCDSLSSVDLSSVAGAMVHDLKTGLLDTPAGSFCKVTGQIAPAINFEVDLPVQHWTQRFLMGGCVGLCGMTRIGISNAGTCAPALNGEMVVASNDLGHASSTLNAQQADFGRVPQKRIDFAYRANHVTALTAKALVKAFYGHEARFSYFIGCSDGGREALAEAQRYPDDFDGISAGAPAGLFTVQNSFSSAWVIRTNQRADGTNILLKGRLPLLHSAVVSHCDTFSGVKDGILEDPRMCHFDPTWVQCAPGQADTSSCLSEEETQAAVRLYNGPADKAGHAFTPGGLLPGSEQNWPLPDTALAKTADYGRVASVMSALLPAQAADQDMDLSKFQFDKASFEQMNQLAALYNAANTNLSAFQKRGGRLVLWHGLADQYISPLSTIAYYQGVQKQAGLEQTENFVRFYLLPGVAHCGGGEGFSQVDFLTPLMAWAETGVAPGALVAGHLQNTVSSAANDAQKISAPQRDGGDDKKHQVNPDDQPYALSDAKTSATRPLYPYPYIARYTGSGDPQDAQNYQPVMAPAILPVLFSDYSQSLIGPDNQSDYTVEKGALTLKK